MAWTSPRTWVNAETVTATICNAHIRDNLSETAPAKVTTAGDTVYATGSNAITRLAIGTAGAVLVTNQAATAPRWSSGALTASGGVANNLVISNTMTAAADNDDITEIRVSATVAKAGHSGLELFGVLVDGAGFAQSGVGTISGAYAAYLSAPTIGTANWSLYVADGSSRLGDGKVFINDTSDANLTTGIVINQGTATDAILTLKQSNIAHGMTSNIETDTFGYLQQYSSNIGGLRVTGVSEGTIGLALYGAHVTGDTTKSTAAVGNIIMLGFKKSGSSFGAMGANENIMVTYDGASCRHILDSDGDSHQDVGTAWTNFDDHDDADLLTALSVYVSKEADPIKREFGKFLKTNREKLESLKLVTFNADGHHFVNMSRLTMLLVGAVRQAAARITSLADRLTAVENKLLLSGV